MDTDHVPEDEKQLTDAIAEAPSPGRVFFSQLLTLVLIVAGIYAVWRGAMEYPATADEYQHLRASVSQADISLTNLPPAGERANAEWGAGVRTWRDKNAERYAVVRLHLYGCYGLLLLGPLTLLAAVVVWWRGQFARTGGRLPLDPMQLSLNAAALVLLAGLWIFDSATSSVMAKTPPVPDLQAFLRIPTDEQKAQRLVSMRTQLEQTFKKLEDKKATPASRANGARVVSSLVWDKQFVATLSDADKQSFRSTLKDLARKTYTDDDTCPALIRAITALGDSALAESLELEREKGRSSWVDVKKPEGVRCLFNAVAAGRESDVRKLIERGINVNAVSPAERHTALHEAVARRQYKVAELLLANKARVDIGGEAGNAELNREFPIHRAVGDPQLVRLLLDKGADPNVMDLRGMSALHVAAALGDKESAELLLARKAKLNALDFGKRTPLDVATNASTAMKAQQTAMREFLVQRGAVTGAQTAPKNSAEAAISPNAR
jgi:hypothetical protein